MMIEKQYDKIIYELTELETECKLEAEKKEHHLTKLIVDIETKLNTWIESLKIPDFTKDNEWKGIRFETAKAIIKMEDELDQFKTDLLLNKDYDFVPKEIDNENNFGDFYVRNVEIGKIRMELNNILNNNKSKNESHDNSKESFAIVKDIPWLIKTKFRKTNETDYLGYFIKPKCDDEKLKQNPIKTKLTLKINQNEARKTEAFKETCLKYDYETSAGFGCSNYISKEDLLNPLNGFYNKEKDSILLQATVRIIS